MTTARSAQGVRSRVAELPDLAAALAVAAVVEIGLRVCTLPRLARLLGVPLGLPEEEGRPQSGPTVSLSPGPARTLSARNKRRLRATRRVMRHWPFGDTCLRQALVSGQRLRRLRPTLYVGVAKVDSEVRAHAWVVADGVVIDPLRAVSSYLSLQAPQAEPAG